ncbi:rhodanese-related sulfurtransferase [Neolewinella xylanilytica]|uniref:Rhodanese-related sulfurtransferase n=1 Tax=Neolewinella xylanilytica TaxID=1514080 RepID=A0A2S6I6N6_9BACT|nr:rhodanese-like domain-containing protein [Neolewinella xylanilytica]PPK87182.1 rhodanese-related sulfurtransferase [Neolewinella xylanilytica]
MRLAIALIGGISLLLLYACRLSGQQVPERLRTGYPPLDERLSTMVTADSASLSPAEAKELSGAIFLDAREPEEYALSHLPGARSLGYKDPTYSVLDGADPGTPLVVYCTIGYRSERMVEELKSRGFRHVYNLYGSVYAWLLAGNPVVNESGETDRVHTYNRKWGTYLPDSIVTKVY